MMRQLTVFACFLLLAACTPPAQTAEPFSQPSPQANQALEEDMALVATQSGIDIADLEQQLAHEDAISELAANLEANEAATFAGLWIEWEPTYQVVVAFTENGEDTVAKYVAAESGLTAVLDIRSATYTYDQLRADQDTAMQQLGNATFDFGSGISVQNNRVDLTVPSPDIWQTFVSDNAMTLPPSVAVDFAFEEVAVEPPTNLNPANDVFIAQKQLPSLFFMEALLSSNLLVADGCLFADNPDGRQLIIWEPGYFVHEGENGRIQILNEAGEVMAEEGQPLYLGGGEGTPPDPEMLNAPIPENCLTGKVWLMGEFLPEAYRP